MKYEKTYLIKDTCDSEESIVSADDVISRAQYWLSQLLDDDQNNNQRETAYYLNQKALLNDPTVSKQAKIKSAREILEIVNVYVYNS